MMHDLVQWVGRNRVSLNQGFRQSASLQQAFAIQPARERGETWPLTSCSLESKSRERFPSTATSGTDLTGSFVVSVDGNSQVTELCQRVGDGR